MSNKFVDADVSPRQEKPLQEGQVKIDLDLYARKLEKQHKVSKLLCEISEYRFREAMANHQFITLMGHMNAGDPGNQQPLPSEPPTNKEESLLTEVNY